MEGYRKHRRLKHVDPDRYLTPEQWRTIAQQYREDIKARGLRNPFPNGVFRYLNRTLRSKSYTSWATMMVAITRNEGMSVVQVEATRALPGEVQYTAGGMLAAACERFVEDFPAPAGAGEQYRRELQQKQQRKKGK